MYSTRAYIHIDIYLYIFLYIFNVLFWHSNRYIAYTPRIPYDTHTSKSMQQLNFGFSKMPSYYHTIAENWEQQELFVRKLYTHIFISIYYSFQYFHAAVARNKYVFELKFLTASPETFQSFEHD